MSELTDKLRAEGRNWKGTELGGLLQWAALHIESQDEALAETREELANEESERLRLENVANATKQAIEAALRSVATAVPQPVDIGRDLVPHINIMAGHGDPDYLKANGMSIRHVDCRTTKPRKSK